MKKIFLIICFILPAAEIFGQQFSQYNTGTLYDSFENPSQRSFIPDSSRQAASNFFFPNITTFIYEKGNAEDVLKSRLFNGYYNTGSLTVGQNKFTRLKSSTTAYWAMAKFFTSLNGNQEIGFAISTKAEAGGYISDESLALFNGYLNFPEDAYNNIFNDSYFYQTYHQFSVSYREQVTPRLSFGVKLSALLGLAYSTVNINNSSIVFDRPNDAATLSLQGVTHTSDKFKWLTLKNPGIAISIGAGYTNHDGFHFQYNLKDLGVIRWRGGSYTAAFANEGTTISDISSTAREKNILDAVTAITSTNKTSLGFYSKTNAIAEVSINKNYWLDYDRHFKLSPTIIASKELFYSGVTGAVVAPVSYNNYTATFTTSYNTIGLFNFGGQFMYKTPNAEFYIGTERLLQTARLMKAAIKSNGNTQRQTAGIDRQYSGADFFIGLSFKFGNVIEHPMNASFIPNGEKGFFGKIFEKIFKGKDKNY